MTPSQLYFQSSGRLCTATFLFCLWTTVHGFTKSHSFRIPSTSKGLRPSSISNHFVTNRRLKFAPSETLSSCTLYGYGRGAEIWPESQDDAIQLSDSFPNGQIPYAAVIAIEKSDMNMVHQRVEASVKHNVDAEESNIVTEVDVDIDVSVVARANSASDTKLDAVTGKLQRRKRLPFKKSKILRRILRRAAAKEELDSEGAISSPIYKTPLVVAFSLLARGWVRPMDVLVVACLSTYFIVLNMAAQSTRDLTGAPILPATPPQGHVPYIVSNPLGRRTEESTWYDAWLKMGVTVGLLGPLAILFRSFIAIKFGTETTGMAIETTRMYARPLFLLCCQIATEAMSRRSLAPLPLRILIPITYNITRLAYLWRWATAPVVLGFIGRGLGIANLAYWAINLFAFLIPVAAVRYMRAHFYGVEAQEVTTRIGLEETVGLVPNFSSF
ncbi:hypothetical protein IV203_022378 [Nitzschia inconspicua]|uniref:DUF7733 domain-containing protein n=1 Tax=Nitzschia inconspicua TaxID=303405 RepID=A0A9K3KJG7_9STRA|nr:hypothetical protein IV203_022378 [Nitzschia inconspicua]